MKCPVCKMELNGTPKSCPNCAFDDIRTEFISMEEKDFWQHNVVEPYVSKKQFRYFIENNAVVLRKYIGNSSTIICPDLIAGLEVQSVNPNAFDESTGYKHIKLPKFLRTIRKDTLPKYCASIHISELCEEIDSYAFKDTRFSEINIPEKVKVINPHTFSMCEYTKRIVLQGVEHICSNAFSKCGIKSHCEDRWGEYDVNLCLPNTLKQIDDLAFDNFATTKIRLPKSVTSINIAAIFGYFILSDGEEFIMVPDIIKNIAFENDNIQIHYNIPMVEEKVTTYSSNGGTAYHVPRYCESIEMCLNLFAELMFPKTITFYCNTDSSAYKYAQKYNIPTKPLSEYPND